MLMSMTVVLSCCPEQAPATHLESLPSHQAQVVHPTHPVHLRWLQELVGVELPPVLSP
jgi:hypothetical protein